MAVRLACSCTPVRGAVLAGQRVSAARGLRAYCVTRRLAISRQLIRALPENNEQTELTGEWPVNWSIASYEDVGEFFKANLFKDTAAPTANLGDVMSTKVTVTTPETPLKDAEKLFVDVGLHKKNASSPSGSEVPQVFCENYILLMWGCRSPAFQL